MSAQNTSKTERLEARLSADLKALLVRAAALQGQSLTDFVLAAAAETARQVIRESEVLELSERDQAAFAASLLDPPEASERLKEAARRHSEELL